MVQLRLQVIILLISLWMVASMQLACDTATSCPQNSICNFHVGTCKCVDGFIGQCNISAFILANTTQALQLKSSDLQYFSISPLQVNKFIDIKINICQNDTQMPLLAYLWGQTGHQFQYNPNNTFNPPMEITFDRNCRILGISNIYFYPQKNGESQKLILGLQNKNNDSMILEVSMDQKIAFGIYMTHYFTIGVLMFLLISMCGCMLANICRRSRILEFPPTITSIDNGEQDYNIDYFQTYLPKKKIEDVSEVENDCPICLQIIETNEIVRKTPCQHIFHSTCIDCWCRKNVNCPVCRSDLTYQYVKAIKDSLSIEFVGQNQKYIKNWEEDVELQDHYTRGSSSIRQEML